MQGDYVLMLQPNVQADLEVTAELDGFVSWT